MSNIIAIPERTKQRIAVLIQQREAIQGRIDEAIVTVRDVMNVPDTWVVRSIDEGFVPGATPPDTEDPNHE